MEHSGKFRGPALVTGDTLSQLSQQSASPHSTDGKSASEKVHKTTHSTTTMSSTAAAMQANQEEAAAAATEYVSSEYPRRLAMRSCHAHVFCHTDLDNLPHEVKHILDEIKEKDKRHQGRHMQSHIVVVADHASAPRSFISRLAHLD